MNANMQAPIRIDDIVETTDRGVCVVVHDTGKRAWLPRAHALFFDRLAMVPVWLAERVLPPVIGRGSRR